jgi:hypothetical protein
VGVLYDYRERIQDHVEKNGLDLYKTRGELALKCGFLLALVTPNDPDDPEKIAALRQAAYEILGLRLD